MRGNIPTIRHVTDTHLGIKHRVVMNILKKGRSFDFGQLLPLFGRMNDVPSMFHENLPLDKKTVPENGGYIVGQRPGIR